MLCAAAAITSSAQSFKTLFSFDGSAGDVPLAGLVQAANGRPYGTTYGGGGGDCSNGCGTVFTILRGGALRSLHTFGGNGDGAYPYSGLIEDMEGNLYGTTSGGGLSGVNGVCAPYGCGTVFKISPSGTLATLHSFDGADGSFPYGTLVQAIDGKLYGTTGGGGSSDGYGYGTVFEITQGGTLTTLHTFCSESNCADGTEPYAGLVQGTDGNFYGTTSTTVFKITPAGTLTTLYTFCSQTGCTDGSEPFAGLIEAADGNLYGTTYYGGTHNTCNEGCGTVFKITPGGRLTTLHSFDSADGAYPYAALIQATDRNLYGTTSGGGANGLGSGTVFEITPAGTLTTLYNFCSQGNCTDGAKPDGALDQDTNGNFYGTTGLGGADDLGTVFSLSMDLNPFVKTEPTAAGVGKPVNILGNSLMGATSVAFNGTAATFTVVSSSLIRATVPAGATSGTVQVVTPGGTLSSNVPFRVIE
jgi:uncharacterized repeat protein (TIGR03803 family)